MTQDMTQIRGTSRHLADGLRQIEVTQISKVTQEMTQPQAGGN